MITGNTIQDNMKAEMSAVNELDKQIEKMLEAREGKVLILKARGALPQAVTN